MRNCLETENLLNSINIWAWKFPFETAKLWQNCGASQNGKIYQININWKSIYLPTNITCKQTLPEYCVSFENFLLFSKAPGDNFWNIFQLNILRLICCFQVFHQAKRRWKVNKFKFGWWKTLSSKKLHQSFWDSREILSKRKETQKSFLSFFPLSLSQSRAFWKKLSTCQPRESFALKFNETFFECANTEQQIIGSSQGLSL